MDTFLGPDYQHRSESSVYLNNKQPRLNAYVMCICIHTCIGNVKLFKLVGKGDKIVMACTHSTVI